MILGEAKYGKIVPEIDGYLPVAALAAFMDVQYGWNISIDNLIDNLFLFGSQYVDLGRPKGLWLVKDKSRLTVPNWCTFRPHAQVPVVAPTDDAVEQSPRQAQDGVLVINRGEVNRTDVLRMALRYMKNAAAVDVVHED